MKVKLKSRQGSLGDGNLQLSGLSICTQSRALVTRASECKAVCAVFIPLLLIDPSQTVMKVQGFGHREKDPSCAQHTRGKRFGMPQPTQRERVWDAGT